jgi:hypothetical protein
MASPHNLRISPETRSGPTDLFFPIALISGEWIACVFTLYMKNIALAAEYRRVIRVRRIGLFYRVCNEPSVTVLDGGNIFPISFMPFYMFVGIRQAITLFA